MSKTKKYDSSSDDEETNEYEKECQMRRYNNIKKYNTTSDMIKEILLQCIIGCQKEYYELEGVYYPIFYENSKTIKHKKNKKLIEEFTLDTYIDKIADDLDQVMIKREKFIKNSSYTDEFDFDKHLCKTIPILNCISIDNREQFEVLIEDYYEFKDK